MVFQKMLRPYLVQRTSKSAIAEVEDAFEGEKSRRVEYRPERPVEIHVWRIVDVLLAIFGAQP